MRWIALALVAVAGCASSTTDAADLSHSADLGLTCPSLASYCSSPTLFPCAEPLSVARTRYCVPDGGTAMGVGTASIADCGAYEELILRGVDIGADFYYDKGTGSLVAVIIETANFGGSGECGGGPATFTPPSCQPRAPFCP